jgi:hypothetical protein
MISQLQKIPIKIQGKLPHSLRSFIIIFLHSPYIYSYLFFRFNFKYVTKLIGYLRKKYIPLYTQNGFGDVFFALLFVNFLKERFPSWKVDLSIHYSNMSKDKNVISLKDGPKFKKFGDYISDLEDRLLDNYFSGYRGDCYSHGFLYFHVPFFRILGYHNIISQTPKVLEKIFVNTPSLSQFYQKKIATFYFRNSSDKLYNAFICFHKDIIEKGYHIYILGEYIPDLLVQNFIGPHSSLELAEKFSFIEKMYLMSNSDVSFTGRGGFALLSLFNGRPTYSFFDSQGVSEFESGLWDFSMWENNILTSPFFPDDSSDYISEIRDSLPKILV